MNWIEFMGPSGVGKTTVLKALRERRMSKKLWFLPYEGIIEIARKRPVQLEKGFLGILKNLYVKQNLFTPLQMRFSHSILGQNIRLENDVENYQDLLQISLAQEVLSREKSPKTIVFRLNRLYKLIKMAALFDYYNFDDIIIFDEGLIKNNPGFIYSKSLSKRNLPKAVIFCETSLDENYSRLKNRKKLAHSHRGLTDLELRKIIQKTHEHAELQKEMMDYYGVPYIVVSLEHELQDKDLQKIEKFIYSFA